MCINEKFKIKHFKYIRTYLLSSKTLKIERKYAFIHRFIKSRLANYLERLATFG